MGLADRAIVYLVLLGYALYVAAILLQHPVRTLSGDPPVRALVGATIAMLVVLLTIKIVLAVFGRVLRRPR